MQILKPLVLYRPDTRGVTMSPYGLGNLKIGPGVYTYSRLPGRPTKDALGLANFNGPTPTVKDLAPATLADSLPEGPLQGQRGWNGTCPGSTPECEEICYAERPVVEMGTVAAMWLANSVTDDVPAIPEDARLLRLHISGDFNTLQYVTNWIERLKARPDVTMWAYTRSWRVPELLPALNVLRGLPNVQLFASMDASCTDTPPVACRVCHQTEHANEQHLVGCPDDCGAHDFWPWPWRRSWIHRSALQSEKSGLPMEERLHPMVKGSDGVDFVLSDRNMVVFESDDPLRTEFTSAFICPEETGDKKNCVECKYCFDGKKNDVVFLEH